MKIRSAKVKDRLWVQADGRLYSLPLAERSRRSGAGGDTASDLTAPFSCKVLQIHVKPGQKVKKGDPVVVVEAMKMEYAYASPREGTIAEVLAQTGKILSAGAPFVSWKDEA